MNESRISFHSGAPHSSQVRYGWGSTDQCCIRTKINRVFWKKESGLTSVSGCYTSTAELTDQVMQVLHICFRATSHLSQPRWVSHEGPKEYLCNMFANLVRTTTNTRGNFLHCTAKYAASLPMALRSHRNKWKIRETQWLRKTKMLHRMWSG